MVGGEVFSGAAGVFGGDDDGGGDGGVVFEDGADVVGFDAVAADLDLIVGAAEVVELAVGVPADEIAGAVEALT